jgi:glycosyltransferase involved in cell wall biosynthesis
MQNAKPNILFLESSRRIGGQEIRMSQVAKHMLANGYGVWFAARNGSELIGSTLGIEYIPVSMSNALDIFGIAKILWLIFKYKIDILIPSSGKDAWLALICAKLTGKKVIRNKALELLKHPFSYNLSDAVVVPSESTKNFLIRGGVKSEKIHVIYPGIDTEKFKFDKKKRADTRAELGIRDDEIVICYVAYFRRPKAQHTLVEAFSKLYSKHPNTKLLFVGGGKEYFDEVKKLSNSLGLEEYVIFTGTKQDTTPYLCASDIFAFTSTSETFGKTIIEALAVGLPVVANNIDTTKEIIKNETLGQTYLAHEVGNLASKLNETVENLSFYQANSEARCEYVRQNFGVNSMYNNFEILLSGFLK